MTKQISANLFDGGNVAPYYEANPDECCICHTSIQPKFINAILTGKVNEEASLLQIVFQCTKDGCQQLFVATYGYAHVENDTLTAHLYRLMKTAPRTAIKTAFSKSINGVSPNFVEIYNQAIGAEAAGLDQITGIGLRKALEFLIKDFTINQRPGDTQAIQGSMLGQVINNYVDDANVKACAARATWLGNDETHYVRKWLDKDITDLKTLIKLTVNWIDNVLLTEEYLKTMNP